MDKKKSMIDISRRDLIKMLSLTGAAGVLTVAQGALSPLIFASTAKAAGTKTLTKARSLQGLRLPTDSNAVISELGPSKAEVRFPRGGTGYMRPGRNQFQDEADLAGYLAQAFPLSKDDKGGYRGSIKRVAKYRRINPYNRTVFTFGDPILDLITDENGILIIGGSRLDMRSAELQDPDQRGGGILALAPTLTAPGSSPSMVREAVYHKEESEFVKCSAKTAVPSLAPDMSFAPEPAVQGGCSTSPLWFPSSIASPRMRFGAWRKKYVIYWSEGTDIETWGRDFTSASISSQYGFFEFGTVCSIAKTDSDSDTNDDYVDEWEWGISAPRPDGHLSNCSALWGGSFFSGVVCKGCAGGWI